MSKDYDGMSGPELLAEYNELAKAKGLKPVKVFRDKPTALRRVKALANGHATGTAPKKEATSQVDKVLAAFGARKGTNRELLLKKLAQNFGHQVKVSALLTAVYGSADEKNRGALSMVMKGAFDMISKNGLTYKIVKNKEDKSYGLYTK